MAGAFAVKTDAGQVLAGIEEARVAVGDVPLMLRVAGELMRASIAHTFRDQGSPAGSWPKLAASTMKNKKYTTGHKLLVMSGRLFGSISYVVSGNTLTIATNVPYAAAQNYGSKASISVRAGARATFKRFGKGVDAKGRSRRMRVAGPASQSLVAGHTRRQNIPARPFMVFQPEDPSRIVEGFEAYLAGKLVRVGRVVKTRTSSSGWVSAQGVTSGGQS